MTNRMFSFINRTWNPIAGGCFIEEGVIYACPYRCVYCWARSLINKWKDGNMAKKYQGPYRIHDVALNQWIRAGDFVAVQFMSDIGAPGIPLSMLSPIFERMKSLDSCRFLLLTKNPACYINMSPHLSKNVILGATIETDREIASWISSAPSTHMRLQYMQLISDTMDFNTFISIEPIMKFSETFAESIKEIAPWAVAIGLDNYGHKLPEHTLAETEALINELDASGIKVYRKTIRKAWDE